MVVTEKFLKVWEGKRNGPRGEVKSSSCQRKKSAWARPAFLSSYRNPGEKQTKHLAALCCSPLCGHQGRPPGQRRESQGADPHIHAAQFRDGPGNHHHGWRPDVRRPAATSIDVLSQTILAKSYQIRPPARRPPPPPPIERTTSTPNSPAPDRPRPSAREIRRRGHLVRLNAGAGQGQST